MLKLYEALGFRPRICVWEIVSRCNLRCLHCASSLGPDARRADELDTPRAVRLTEELAELGCEYAVLSGGEPLLRQDWPVLARSFRSHGVTVGMISNGILLDVPTAKAVKASGVSVVAVSVDGLEATHDRIRQREGAFRAALRALRNAADEGLRIHVVTHVNRLNRADVPRLRSVLEEIGVRTWLVQLSAPMGRMKARRDLILDREEVRELATWLASTREGGRMHVAVGDNIGYFSPLEETLRRNGDDSPFPFWCGCVAGMLAVGIESNGNVKGCLSLQEDRFIEGNVTSTSLRDIWESPTAFAYTRRFTVDKLHGACEGCDLGEVCRGGCTFMATAATGQPHDFPLCLSGSSQAK